MIPFVEDMLMDELEFETYETYASLHIERVHCSPATRKSSSEINRGELSYRMMEELCGVRRDFYVPDIKYKMGNKANNQLKDQVPNSLSGQGFYFLFNFFR